jgi:hypothetical protein
VSLVKRAAIAFASFLLFVSLSGFGLVFTLDRTVLNPDFVVHELESLDVAPLAKEVLRAQIPPEIQSFVSAEFIDEVLDDLVVDLEPWAREQAEEAVYAGYDYLLGRTEDLSLLIDFETVKGQARDTIWRVFSTSPPPGLDFIPAAQLEPLFNQIYDNFSDQIPDTLEINVSVIDEIDPGIMPRLAQARRYIGYLRMAYWAFIAGIALTIMGIILLTRRVRGATRWIGIPCLISGIVIYAGTFAIRHFAGLVIEQLILPAQLQVWLPQFLEHGLVPMQIYGIVFMIVGTALLIISVVYRRGESEY